MVLIIADTDTIYCEGQRTIHKEGVGGRGGVNAHYTSALMFNDSMDDVHCSSDSTYIPLHTEITMKTYIADTKNIE